MAQTPERRREYRRGEKWKAYMRDYRARNPEKFIQYDLKKDWNLTTEQFAKLLAEQDGKCAICRTPNPGKHIRRFSIDHDHTTGKMRALLCNRCNRVLGLLDDNPELLIRMAFYLTLFSENET